MSIKTIFAHVSCSNLAASSEWYEKLFGKPVTRRPMAGLAEWHFTDSAEVQLFENAEHAGSSTLTLGVSELQSERKRLEAAGLAPGQIEEAKYLNIMRLNDPDRNLVVLASPKPQAEA